MRLHAILLIATLFYSPLTAADVRLSPRFRTVYILEMANGFDQHLANRLTANRVLWVVLEPNSADAVMTESLDDGFWNWLAKAYPAAPGTTPQGGGRGSASPRESAVNPRHAGMVFLVDPRTRLVLWSAWETPKKPTPGELAHTADRIANQLKSAFEKK